MTAVITGPAGIGKTALALWVAHAVRDVFPDGQLYAALNGSDPANAPDTATVLAGFLHALGVPRTRLPERVEERAALFRSVVHGRRILVVLDDIGRERDVRSLFPAHAEAAVLLTGRRAPYGLDLGHTVALQEFTQAEAIALLGILAGADRVEAEREAADEIVRCCGGLPLAVRIAGARLAARPDWPLSVFASRLRDERRRLDELVAGDLAVRTGLAVIERSMVAPAWRAFCHLGVFGPEEFSPGMLAALTDLPLAEAELHAEQLAEAHLVNPAGAVADDGPRYRVHDLARLFACELAGTRLTETERRAALHRLLTWLIERVGSEQSGQTGRSGWIERERRTLVRAVELAHQAGLHHQACYLSAGLVRFFRRYNTFDDWWRTHAAALGAARAAADEIGEATVLLGLGQLRYEQDRMDESRAYFEQALDLCLAGNHPRGAGQALIGIATIDREQGSYTAALRSLRRAEMLFRRVDGAAGLADCAYGLSCLYREIGDLKTARRYGFDAIEAYLEAGDQRGHAVALRSMAMVSRAANQLDAAAECAAQAVTISAATDDELLATYCWQSLAKIRIRQGKASAARGPLTDGLAVCHGLHDRFGSALIMRTLGELHLATDDLGSAELMLTSSRTLWQTLGLPVFRARVDRDLAVVHERSGDPERAMQVRQAALATFRHHGAREYRELTACHASTAS